jgi:hypothetical protein
MSDTTIEELNEELKQSKRALELLATKSNQLLNILETRISLTRQNFKTFQSDDPSVGMRLTDQQRGWWEGRIETWEYALILARELFQE